MGREIVSTGHAAIQRGERTRPIITSRLTYRDDGSITCEVELRDGTRASGTLTRAMLKQGLPPDVLQRVLMVHEALLIWGVGDASWHRRAVGRAACLLLAEMLPRDGDQFANLLASPEAVAGYLSAPRST